MAHVRTILASFALAWFASSGSPAIAQDSTAYVSRTGTEPVFCRLESPCRALPAALAFVEPGGVVHCLDGYMFAAITITKPVTIDCRGVGASIYSGGAAITINIDEGIYQNAVVVIRGLTLHGLRSLTGANGDGIRLTNGGSALIVEDCAISSFPQQAIDFRPVSTMSLVIRNTTITDNAGGGIYILPASGSRALVSLDNVILDRNLPYGLQALDGALVDVSDSVAFNQDIGFFAASLNRGVDIMLERTTVSHSKRGVVGAGANGSIRVSNSLLTGNNLAMDGNVISLGGNSLTDNATNGTFKSTIAKR